jgi:hypothetical protein
MVKDFPPPLPYAVALLLPLAELPPTGTEVLPRKIFNPDNDNSTARLTAAAPSTTFAATTGPSTTLSTATAATFATATTLSATYVLISRTCDKRNTHCVQVIKGGGNKLLKNEKALLIYDSTGPSSPPRMVCRCRSSFLVVRGQVGSTLDSLHRLCHSSRLALAPVKIVC